MLKALIFDCDGVLADTERDGHRVAFNRAFARQALPIEWGVEVYGELLKIAGGKERMRHYFNEHGWPPRVTDRDAYLLELHKLKTALYMDIVEGGQLPARPGVCRLVDEAIADGMLLAVCSTSNERAVNAVVTRCSARRARPTSIRSWPATSSRRRSRTRRYTTWPASG